MPSEKRKARKQNYFKAAKQSRRFQEGKILKEGMKGFLLTCNNREKETVREAYNLLNEFADKIFGPELANAGPDVEGDEEEEDMDEDIDAAFEKEKSELVEIKAKTVSGERRFQMVDSGARNCVFVRTTLEEPEQLATEIIDTILSSGEARARYILRLVPILGTCKAHEKNIEDLARAALAPVFPSSSSVTYSVLFKTRNNGSIGRDTVIRLVGGVVRELAGETSVDLKAPEVAIVVEIIRNVCCLGVVREYFGRRRKYNLVELLKTEADTESSADKKEVQGEEVAGESPAETEEEGLKVEDHGGGIAVADSVPVEVKAEDVETEEIKTEEVETEEVKTEEGKTEEVKTDDVQTTDVPQESIDKE